VVLINYSNIIKNNMSYKTADIGLSAWGHKEKMQRKLFDIFFSRLEVFWRASEMTMEADKIVSLTRAWEEYLLGLGIERIEKTIFAGPLCPPHGTVLPMGEDSVIIRCPCPLFNKDSHRSWLVVPQDLAFKILALGSLP